jgi:ABC-2 type transport system ATP-binding protein
MRPTVAADAARLLRTGDLQFRPALQRTPRRPRAGGYTAGMATPAQHAPQPHAIVVENLVFDYPGQRALHGVSFSVARGAVAALVGPNGAGKTTLLSCVAALLRPVAGTVLVDGVDMLAHPREGHRRIGYLKDFFGLYDALSVRQTLWHAARVQGVVTARCDEVVAAVAGDLDLEPLLHKPAGALSRGQRQRLAIARTLVHGPAVLLLDEPASGLDPEARADLAALMRRLRDAGTTLLVSSHILAELAEYSSEMLIIRDGRLLEQRSLHGEPGARSLRMELCVPPAGVPAVLAAYPGVSDARVDGDALVFAFHGDAAQRHRLLRACLDAGVAVAGLAESGAGLQREYLQRMRAGAPDGR